MKIVDRQIAYQTDDDDDDDDDVITCADLYYDRLRGLGVAGGQILGFSIDLLRRPYNTLALPCECVISQVAQ